LTRVGERQGRVLINKFIPWGEGAWEGVEKRGCKKRRRRRRM